MNKTKDGFAPHFWRTNPFKLIAIQAISLEVV
jgi:hypothetical protein